MNRQPAWHHLGTTLHNTTTAEEAMSASLLTGWNVRALLLYAGSPHGTLVPHKRAIVRTNPSTKATEPIGVVGNRYHPIQNEEYAPLLNDLAHHSGAQFDTAGSLKDGRIVFVTMKTPTTIQAGPDHAELHLAAVTSHDGSTPLIITATPVLRATTLALKLPGGATPEIKVRHSLGALTRLGEAEQVLEKVHQYANAFTELAERMASTELRHDAFQDLIKRELLSQTDHTPSAAKTNRKETEILELFGPGDGTTWSGFTALAEWADHHSPSRGTNRDTARAYRAVFEPTFKQRALSALA